MGGHALEQFGIQTVRIDRATYEEVVNSLSNIFSSESRIKNHYIVPSFKSKDSFGDIDVIIQIEPHGHNRDCIHGALNVAFNGLSNLPIYNNGPVTSFAYKLPILKFGKPQDLFQVDVIFTYSADEFTKMCNYHGNGDIGNFIGRIYHALGLKYGHDGLTYQHMNGTYVVGEIDFNLDQHQILEFIGLDSSVTEFETQEDVYNYVMSSPFFHPSLFAFENRNHQARTRDSKRPSYNKFLDYMETKQFPEKPLAGKDYHMVAICTFDKLAEYMTLVKQEAARLASKAILDAKFVAAQSELSGPELGNLMKTLKNNNPPYSMLIDAHNFLAARQDILKQIGDL